MSDSSNSDVIFDGDTKLLTEKKLDVPKMYKVLLHNDHYTTMDFVIEVLTKIFNMPSQKAEKIMLDVHKKGIGICGVYTHDIAVTKYRSFFREALSEFPFIFPTWIFQHVLGYLPDS